MYYLYSKFGSQESHRQVCLARSTHEETSFHISCWRHDRHFYVVIRATLWSSRWQGNGITFFLSIFKKLSIGPATTIVPATFHSATQPSTDLTNPPNSITIGLYPSKSWWETTERFQMLPIHLSNLSQSEVLEGRFQKKQNCTWSLGVWASCCLICMNTMSKANVWTRSFKAWSCSNTLVKTTADSPARKEKLM